MLYSFGPLLLGLFLLDSTENQYAFSVLPNKMQQWWVLKILFALTEFRFAHFLMAMAHFGAFHCVTFIRVIQTAPTNSAKIIK